MSEQFMNRSLQTDSSQAGFNLIEVLVAMVVLSIGLLGIAGLQLTGVRANQSAYYRSQAISVMNDMIERMHVNLPGATQGLYADYDSNAGCGAAPAVCAQENGGAAPAACTAAQMAAYDRFVVACGMRNGVGTNRVGRITDLLPDGRIQVQCVNNAGVGAVVNAAACTPGFRHRVTVTWTERTQANAANPSQTALQTQTVTMTVQP